MKGPLDSRQLHAFVILARTGSFTQTARELFLTQSAVSHSMKALETDVGCRLFDRVGKKVMLTQAGETLLQRADRALTEMGAAREEIQRLGKWGRGRLRLAAPVSVCVGLLPSVLREFQESFPDSLVTVEPGDSHEVIGLLEQHRVDLALVPEARADERVESVPLFRDELRFLVSPLHPWAAGGLPPRDEIPRQSLIVYGRSSRTWRLVDDYFREEKITLNTPMEVRSMDAIRELTKLNLGVGILSPWTCRADLEQGSLVSLPLGRRRLTREWGILEWRGRRRTLAEETFVGLCREAARTLGAGEGMAGS